MTDSVPGSNESLEDGQRTGDTSPLAVGNPYAPTSHTLDIEPAVDDVEAYRRAHLRHEASCQSIGSLFFVGAFMLVLIGSLMIFGGWVTGGTRVDEEMMLIGLVYFTIGVVQGWIGWGLRHLREWGRTSGAVISAVGLLGFPVGTLFGAYFLYLLLCRKGRIVFSADYQRVIEQTPQIRYRTPVIVWLVLLVLFLAIVWAVAVAGGFRFSTW